ncbi:MAG TPA: molybdenum cofactor guanylyltransferase [Bryobacteraceae bacterium]|nr:molybdenum cofactor guanylyltransferase [Bryobacteraceae bacterium]
MTASGFVLAGGASSRMGRDKALLPYHGTALVDHVARAVRDAAGNVAIIGHPNGIPDLLPGLGPIGGLYTALNITQTDWNLVVACDMPGISADPLRILLKRAEISDCDGVAARSPGGTLEPLCAVYHRRCLPTVTRAIRDKRLKMLDLLSELSVEAQPIDHALLANANTPAEWAAFENESK